MERGFDNESRHGFDDFIVRKPEAVDSVGCIEAPQPSPQVRHVHGAGDAGASRQTRANDLLECLLVLANLHGLTATADSLLAGLPVGPDGLTPALFDRAARRANMSSQVVAASLDALNRALLPAILLLRDNRACVLAGWTEDGARARLIFPELGDTVVELPRAELEAIYAGRTLYARPRVHFDARAPEVTTRKGAHWFWSEIAANRSLYRDVLVAAFLINLFAIGMPLFVMNVYDRVVPNQAFETLWVLAAGLMIVLVGEVALRTLRGHFVDLASSRADVRISTHIMERVLGMRMEERPASAGSFAANLRAFESVRDFIGSATVVAFVDLPFALLFLLVIAWIAPLMILPFAIGVTLLALYAATMQRRMRELAETTYRASAARNAGLVEGLVGLEAVKTQVAESVIQRRWEQSVALLSHATARLRLLASSAMNGAAFVQQTVSVAMIALGVYLIADGKLSMGGLIACYLLSSRAMAPAGQVVGLLMQYHNAFTALRSLDQMMAREVERPEGRGFISRGHLRGDIEFRDVAFSYPGQTAEALRNVSFRIRAGEHVAIIGRVGSGKSTIEKLILGLYRPTQGAVLVDGIDLRQLDPAELRRQIGYVSQDVTLFYGTLRDNITFGVPFAEDEDVVRAAGIGGILEHTNAHPQGFDMPVGERGESLSGGQRQAVGIARAVVHSPSILLLDEPTAAMDHTSEEQVKQRLGEFVHGRTMVVVTHRNSLLDLVDRIIVIDGGRVVADGPRKQVMDALRQGRVGRAS